MRPGDHWPVPAPPVRKILTHGHLRLRHGEPHWFGAEDPTCTHPSVREMCLHNGVTRMLVGVGYSCTWCDAIWTAMWHPEDCGFLPKRWRPVDVPYYGPTSNLVGRCA